LDRFASRVSPEEVRGVPQKRAQPTRWPAPRTSASAKCYAQGYDLSAPLHIAPTFLGGGLGVVKDPEPGVTSGKRSLIGDRLVQERQITLAGAVEKRSEE